MDAHERQGRGHAFLQTVLRAGLACLAVLLLAGWTDPIAIAVAAVLVLLFSWWFAAMRHRTGARSMRGIETTRDSTGRDQSRS